MSKRGERSIAVIGKAVLEFFGTALLCELGGVLVVSLNGLQRNQ